MNHCPVYQSIGGHAYGWVYPGPMGSVLTPTYVGLENALDLPQASTLCNQCGVVCPVKIPLPDLLRKLRERHALDHESDRGLRLETFPRHGQCNQQRGKSHRQIGKPRVSTRKTAHRGLYVGAKTPETTLHEFVARSITRAESALGAQHMQLHEQAF